MDINQELEKVRRLSVLIEANRIKAEDDAKAIYELMNKMKKSFDDFDEKLKTILGK